MSTNDRELLEMAAKAGYGFSQPAWAAVSDGTPVVFELFGVPWTPLEDEGDAARLAMKLCAEGKMRIQITEQSITCFYNHDGVFVPWSWGYETCTLSQAFCRCVTGAAAEIGRKMP